MAYSSLRHEFYVGDGGRHIQLSPRLLFNAFYDSTQTHYGVMLVPARETCTHAFLIIGSYTLYLRSLLKGTIE